VLAAAARPSSSRPTPPFPRRPRRPSHAGRAALPTQAAPPCPASRAPPCTGPQPARRPPCTVRRSGRPCRAAAAAICTGDSCCVHLECDPLGVRPILPRYSFMPQH
jgi:hypothetical protein